MSILIEKVKMTYSYLNEDYSDLTREDAARLLADHLVKDQEKEYCDNNLLGTDRDLVVDNLAEKIIYGFEMGQLSDPRIQLSDYESGM